MKLAILSVLLISTPALAHSSDFDPIKKEESQLHCELSTQMEAARDQQLSGKITYRDFTMQYLCGMETKGLKGTALETSLKECRKHLDGVADEWFANLSKEELAKKLQNSFGKHGIKDAKFDKILKQGKAALIAALFNPHKTSELSGHQKESMSGGLSSDMEFGPLSRQFHLTELGTPAEKELRADKYFSEKYYRVVEIEGKRYFEPAYGDGEFHLGKLENLDAAKKLFPDAMEVLGTSNAALGSTLGQLRVVAWGKKEVSFRALAVRRANGQVDGVLQLLEAPAEFDKPFSEKYYRVVEIDGKRYFEPAYGDGEFHLGKVENLDAAKKLFPDAVEVLGTSNASLGSTQGQLRVVAWGKKEVSFRALAVRRANGQVDGVLQLLEAPAETAKPFDPIRHKMDMSKIKVLQQFIVPGDGKALEMDLTQLAGMPKNDEISGLPITKYTMKATCSMPPAKLPAGANADGPLGDNSAASAE